MTDKRHCWRIYLIWSLLAGLLAFPPPSLGTPPSPADKSSTTASDPTGGGNSSVGSLYLKAKSLSRVNPPEAARLYRQAIDKFPNHFNSRYELAGLLMQSSPTEALLHLETARRLSPSSHSVHYLLGQVQERLGRLLEAAESYRQAIRLNPRHYDANTRLRGILRRLRGSKTRVEKAAEELYQAPSMAALTLFGKVVMAETSPRQALLEFEEARRRVPHMPEVMLWIARAYRGLGENEAEIEAYKVYLQENSGALGVQLLLLERLQEGGYFREAAEQADAFRPGPEELTRFSPLTRSRLYYLKSRVASVRQQPDEAADFLLKSLLDGMDRESLGKAFSEDLALYPENGFLWHSHAQWMLKLKKYREALDSLLNAGLYQPALRKQSGELIRAVRQEPPDGKEDLTPLANLALGELALADGQSALALENLEQVPPGHALDARASLLRGKILRSQGNLEGALDAFLRYVMFQENKPEMLYARGNVMFMLGRTDEALKIWEESPGGLEAHPETLAFLARHYREAGNAPRETGIREILARVRPEDHHNRVLLGALLREQGKTAEALKQWEKALTYRPRDPVLLENLGRTCLELGGQPGAKTAATYQSRGIDYLARVSRIRKLDDDLNGLLAEALYRRGSLEDALRIFIDLYRKNPDDPRTVKVLPELVLSVPADQDIRRIAVSLALKQGDISTAGQILEIYLDDFPQDEEARMNLADIRMRQQRPDDAERIMSANLDGPGSQDARLLPRLRLLLDIQEKLGRRTAIVKTLERLIRLEPSDRALPRRLGLLLAELGREDEAQGYLEEALKDDPSDEQVRMMLGRRALKSEDNRAALEHFYAALRKNPDNTEAGQECIRLALTGKDWEKAAFALNIHITRDPEDDKERYNLVLSLLHLRRHKEARPHYDTLRTRDEVRADRLKKYFPEKKGK
ncbi:MAG: tetratricopeptide repeat protein [Deltaproteobacteria bacterium]|nr:tetratricopeptide repeat protein [Deltaproteobacteria bacterium]